jgi:hypothetical protein
MSVCKAITEAFLSEHPFYFATEGIVKSVKTDTCEVALKNNKQKTYKDVRWLPPVKPKKGSKCLLVFRDNKEERATAFCFAELDEIDTTIGKLTDLSIDDNGGVICTFSTQAKVELSSTSTKLTFGSNSIEITATGIALTGQLNISGDVSITGKTEITGDTKLVGKVDATGDVKVTGKVDTTGDVKVTGKVDTTGDVIANGISVSTHTHQYVDTPVGPAVTGLPQ